jgi:YebC/PmpR family DNA-binding regulatory protein
MAGHSKWANIKHRKAKQDKKRSKVWSKCSKAIMAAARQGGADPDSNLSLRYAIDEAKYANMPKDTIKRAIEKGAGAGGGDAFEAVTYEGFGPSGVAVIIDALTDNRTRTVSELRTIFKKAGGVLGNSGAVAYMFSTKGRIILDASTTTEETVTSVAIDAGADDIQPPEGDGGDGPGYWMILTDPAAFLSVKDAVEAAGITIVEAEIAKIPAETTELAGEDAKKVYDLLDAIEDNDDVQKVYSNAEIDESSFAGG